MIIPTPETISDALEMQPALEGIVSDWRLLNAQERLTETAQYSERYQAVEQCKYILNTIAEYQEQLHGTKQS